ncbi:MAG: cupin domain-containing protein [Candidatus Aenigmarchaeota archaeon]|nr:cupin domain-containing protein [Candidatus Aenigmarchaeota archaeon]
MVDKVRFIDVKPLEDACGLLRELYHSDNMSIAHVEVIRDARKHKHLKMEEVYYVNKGIGQLYLGGKVLGIEEGDTIPIPKGTWHYLKKFRDIKLEVLAITHPRYDPEDVIFEE